MFLCFCIFILYMGSANKTYTIVLSHEDNMVEEGKFFTAFKKITGLDNTDTAYIHIKTGSNHIHAGAVIIGAKATEVGYFRNPTITDDGTEIEPNGNNMTINKVPTTKIYHTPTVTDDGKQLDGGYLGTSQGAVKIGGESSLVDHWIMASNSSYLLKITSFADGNTVWATVKFEEEEL